jgi:hypothetical protein
MFAVTDVAKEAALRALGEFTGQTDPEKPWWNLNMSKALDIMLPAIREAIGQESAAPPVPDPVIDRSTLPDPTTPTELVTYLTKLTDRLFGFARGQRDRYQQGHIYGQGEGVMLSKQIIEQYLQSTGQL